MTELRRGKGPWPRENTETVVSAWLLERLLGVEESERLATVRWMLDSVSSQSKGERIAHRFRWSESLLDRLATGAERLNEGEPLQHVLGESWFDGLSIKVNRSVLIPRPETEELVVAISERIQPGEDSNQLVVDWCTGSGCVALALKQRFPKTEILGWDLSEEAIEVAQINARNCNLDVTFEVHDALDAPRLVRPADAVVSNPPYIPRSEASSMHPRVTEHEPDMALFVPDDDPLLFYRALEAWCASGNLRPGGWIGLECHTRLASEVAQMLVQHGGWLNVDILFDLQGLPRHVVAQRELP